MNSIHSNLDWVELSCVSREQRRTAELNVVIRGKFKKILTDLWTDGKYMLGVSCMLFNPLDYLYNLKYCEKDILARSRST